MNPTYRLGPRRLDRQTACAAIALVVAVTLTWSFVSSTRLVQWPASQALIAGLRAAVVASVTQPEASAPPRATR